MLKIVDRLRRGRGRLEDLKILDEIGNAIGIMPGTTICGLADGAGWPVKNAVKKFRAELEEHIRQGPVADTPVFVPSVGRSS
jgi:NADH-quinone oxidoreductase subunit F